MATLPRFDVPDHLIAQQPLPQRDQSRMMVLRRGDDSLTHRRFGDLAAVLPADALLVLNNTRVLPHRLPGRLPTGGSIEALLLTQVQPGRWEALVKRSRRLRPGLSLSFCGGAIQARAVEPTGEGRWLLDFDDAESLPRRLEEHGLAPLPPYIHRGGGVLPEERQRDREAYQTVFARVAGAVAAPTAGLHFTPALLSGLDERGFERVEVTLHVGLGTFKPLPPGDPADHRMHAEWMRITPETAGRILRAQAQGRPVIAVGTTMVRALESWAAQGKPKGIELWTDLYIRDSYPFQVVDGMITNFHQPRSTLLLLVAAFYGLDRLTAAYHAAIAERYRFFSFGDCMAILPMTSPAGGI